MSNNLEYIVISDITHQLKEKYKFLPLEEANQYIEESLDKGIYFKNSLIKTVHIPFYNKLIQKQTKRYYFVCPECKKNSAKILWDNITGKVACTLCLGIKSTLTAARPKSSQAKILKIQEFVNELLSGNISVKRRKKLLAYIVDNYAGLDNKYKLFYNTFIFKELQNWCLDILSSGDKPKEYQKAVKDILVFLKSARVILANTKLSGVKNKNLEI